MPKGNEEQLRVKSVINYLAKFADLKGEKIMNTGGQGNRVIVTVLGKDQVGICAWIASLLAQHNANILDISQTILQEFFTMIMVVDTSAVAVDFNELRKLVAEEGQAKGLQVTMQHEDVFRFMHRI